MSTAATAANTRTDPADRGRTVIADRVVERTAARLASEVEHVRGVDRQLPGRLLGRPAAVSADAHTDGRLAQLRLDLTVAYPAPIREVTRQARRHVRDNVRRLCGVTVTDLDIRVAALRQDDPEPQKRTVL